MATAGVWVRGKGTLAGKGRFGAGGKATHIDIKGLKAGLIVMLMALTVLAINAIHRLFHLLHVLCCTSIQCVLHHRLLGTATAPEGSLQGDIGSQARIYLDHSMGSCQQAVKGRIEFVRRPFLDRLLGNLPPFSTAPNQLTL